MRVLAVIPARGGSKGIPRKNVRLLNGRPLISYAIQNALTCGEIDDVVVTTDDAEIASVARLCGAEVIDRDPALADDVTTLDPVIHDAVVRCEAEKGVHYDTVVTLQPTSPLMRAETLKGALRHFAAGDVDSLISAVNSPHLAWSKDDTGFYPLYNERLNRQYLPPYYGETGAFFITRREFVHQESRMGDRVSVYEVPVDEAVDIDTENDWILCERGLAKKRIVLRCDGYREIGLGHIYRCLTLAYQLIGHQLLFVTHPGTEGHDKIVASHFPCETAESDTDFFAVLERFQPDIIVNDTLDTTKPYMKALKERAHRVVSFEDLGEGAPYADAVINALYEAGETGNNVYSGRKYFCLRDEFLIQKPIEIRDSVKNVLVLFGGTDPAGLTRKVYDMARELGGSDVTFTFVTAIGYDADKNGVVSSDNIRVLEHLNGIAAVMREADIAICSQGRTVYELASMGIPAIVMAQNEREQLHTFAHMENGFLNLGLGSKVASQTLKNTFRLLCTAPEIRRNMQELMLRHDLRRGVRRVKHLILEDER